MHTTYKSMGFDYPNAYAQFATEITLPLHTSLPDEDAEYVIEAYIDVTQRYR